MWLLVWLVVAGSRATFVHVRHRPRAADFDKVVAEFANVRGGLSSMERRPLLARDAPSTLLREPEEPTEPAEGVQVEALQAALKAAQSSEEQTVEDATLVERQAAAKERVLRAKLIKVLRIKRDYAAKVHGAQARLAGLEHRLNASLANVSTLTAQEAADRALARAERAGREKAEAIADRLATVLAEKEKALKEDGDKLAQYGGWVAALQAETNLSRTVIAGLEGDLSSVKEARAWLETRARSLQATLAASQQNASSLEQSNASAALASARAARELAECATTQSSLEEALHDERQRGEAAVAEAAMRGGEQDTALQHAATLERELNATRAALAKETALTRASATSAASSHDAAASAQAALAAALHEAKELRAKLEATMETQMQWQSEHAKDVNASTGAAARLATVREALDATERRLHATEVEKVLLIEGQRNLERDVRALQAKLDRAEAAAGEQQKAAQANEAQSGAQSAAQAALEQELRQAQAQLREASATERATEQELRQARATEQRQEQERAAEAATERQERAAQLQQLRGEQAERAKAQELAQQATAAREAEAAREARQSEHEAARAASLQRDVASQRSAAADARAELARLRHRLDAQVAQASNGTALAIESQQRADLKVLDLEAKMQALQVSRPAVDRDLDLEEGDFSDD